MNNKKIQRIISFAIISTIFGFRGSNDPNTIEKRDDSSQIVILNDNITPLKEHSSNLGPSNSDNIKEAVVINPNATEESNPINNDTIIPETKSSSGNIETDSDTSSENHDSDTSIPQAFNDIIKKIGEDIPRYYGFLSSLIEALRKKSREDLIPALEKDRPKYGNLFSSLHKAIEEWALQKWTEFKDDSKQKLTEFKGLYEKSLQNKGVVKYSSTNNQIRRRYISFPICQDDSDPFDYCLKLDSSIDLDTIIATEQSEKDDENLPKPKIIHVYYHRNGNSLHKYEDTLDPSQAYFPIYRNITDVKLSAEEAQNLPEPQIIHVCYKKILRLCCRSKATYSKDDNGMIPCHQFQDTLKGYSVKMKLESMTEDEIENALLFDTSLDELSSRMMINEFFCIKLFEF